MDLRQFEYFVTVARLGHFTQSADALHVGQPALSQAIRRLERELGVELLDRATHPITLTSAGRALLPHAEQIADAVAAARAEFGLIGGQPGGRVTLGVLAMLGPAEKIVAEFHRAHPSVAFVLKEGLTRTLTEQLLSGQIDVMLATKIDPIPRQVDHFTAFIEPMVAMTPVGWTTKTSLPLSDLSGHTIMMPPEGSGVRAIVEAALRRESVTWSTGPETSDIARQRYLTAQGVGVTIVPSAAKSLDGPPVDFVPLETPVNREVALMWRVDRHHGASVRAFLEIAKKLLGDSPESLSRWASY